MSVIVIEAPETTVTDEPEVLNPAQQLLLGAEEYLLTHGWCPMAQNGDAVCVLVAMSHVRPVMTRATVEAMEALRAALPKGCSGIARFNDYYCQDQDEAIAYVRKAREIAGNR